MRLPTRLDRYPAKMVSRLAEDLVARYADNATRVLDPFCGSGAVLMAAARAGIPVTGIDINPMGVLLSRTKLNGFEPSVATELVEEIIDRAKSTRNPSTIEWDARDYWFTPKTLEKFERLRAGIAETRVRTNDKEWTAILLSLALSVRLCSRADQRSPKPFISATARANRSARHFDPYYFLRSIIEDLSVLYGRNSPLVKSNIVMANVVQEKQLKARIGSHSHVITSPPYINAQDYFRNFKLELHVLDSLLPFETSMIKENFVGTDRGNLTRGVSEDEIVEFRSLVRGMRGLEKRSPRLGEVVYRYLHDMGTVFGRIDQWLKPKGRLVLVCGDNLVGGMRIPTWQVLQKMLEARGFAVVDTFRDQIRDRMLAPKRSGHKGLIKEEVICCYERSWPVIRSSDSETS